MVSRSTGGIGLVFALQTLPIMLNALPEQRPGWGLAMALAVFGSIGLLVVATVVKRGVRIASGLVAGVYALALVAWPFLLPHSQLVQSEKPWLWWLCTVATSSAALCLPVMWAAIYTVVVPVIYGVVRTLPSGGGAEVLLASLDAVYAILLGQVVLIIIFVLRQATAAVDVAQANALQKYGSAVRQHATELERVEVDSIVHDSVLTTLLSAAAVRTQQEAKLAADMARQAISRLSDAGPVTAGDETVIPFARLSRRIRQAANAFASPFAVVENDIDFLTVPVHASDALYSATVQAMVNSMQHAGPADVPLERTLTMSSNLQGGCTIEITDSGVGFDPDAVPSERLGLRISIIERVTSVGGAVTVRTSPGQGAAVTIEWPRLGYQPDYLATTFSPDELPALGLGEGTEKPNGSVA
ncbi:MAG: two-component system sensor protein [Cryobacterium sp.]|nr:two-component system sensor protein [Cryobacterium sp.]